MNKAIELLNDWVQEKEKYLIILIERRDSEKGWSEKDSHKDCYTPKYLLTKGQVEALEIGIKECKQALKYLCSVPTE